MPLAFNNKAKWQAKGNKLPSVACNLVASPKFQEILQSLPAPKIPDLPRSVMLCCSEVECIVTDTCSPPNKVSNCRDIKGIEDCDRRVDCLPRRVCDRKNDFFCITTEAAEVGFTYLPEAIQWMLRRNAPKKTERNTKVCYNYGTKDYRECDGPPDAGFSREINIECGDLFNDEYDCFWTDSRAKIPRNPLGEICEINPPTVQTTVSCEAAMTKTII